jgi:hypothetical protein
LPIIYADFRLDYKLATLPDIVPFADDEFLLGLSHRPDDCITVLAWLFEADQGSADFIVQILVARRELVSEQMQQGEIDLIWHRAYRSNESPAGCMSCC